MKTGKESPVARLDLTDTAWRKSSRSSNYGNCVEIAFVGPAVAARDSKDPAGAALVFGAHTWTAFVGDVKAGRFDG